jgi:hypothetical protein
VAKLILVLLVLASFTATAGATPIEIDGGWATTDYDFSMRLTSHDQVIVPYFDLFGVSFQHQPEVTLTFYHNNGDPRVPDLQIHFSHEVVPPAQRPMGSPPNHLPLVVTSVPFTMTAVLNSHTDPVELYGQGLFTITWYPELLCVPYGCGYVYQLLPNYSYTFMPAVPDGDPPAVMLVSIGVALFGVMRVLKRREYP